MRSAKTHQQGGLPTNLTSESVLSSVAGQGMQPGRPPPRGDPSMDSQMVITARSRLRRALKQGYEDVYDRFNRDDAFATSLTGEGLRHCNCQLPLDLPNSDRRESPS